MENVGGIKNDQEKVRLDLLSAAWVEGVGRVLTFGAQKYAAHNWRKGIQTGRLLGAALRHVFAYLRGEDLDPETGLSHLLHASCCLMFAFELSQTQPELDDRYKVSCQKTQSPKSISVTDVSHSKPQDSPAVSVESATKKKYTCEACNDTGSFRGKLSKELISCHCVSDR